MTQFARELIRVRFGEGLERAKARGVKFRPTKFNLTSRQQNDAGKRYVHGDEILPEIAIRFNVSHSPVSRIAR